MNVQDIPLPNPSTLSRPFWEAANEGRFVLQCCGECGKYRWTPQVVCPHCLGEPFEWAEVSGRGEVYSFTVIHRPPLPAFETPYVIAVVELAEGPLMLTRLIGCEPDDVRVGAAVEISFTRANEDINLYTFRLAQGAEPAS